MVSAKAGQKKIPEAEQTKVVEKSISSSSSSSSGNDDEEEEYENQRSSDNDDMVWDIEDLKKQKRKKNKKMRDENVIFTKTKSNGTCKISDIEGFIFGPSSSRFWMMRKHINSLDNTNRRIVKLPFYAWQCITLQMNLRDVDLVIQEERHMKIFLQFLILSLQTVDGLRSTARPHLNYIFK